MSQQDQGEGGKVKAKGRSAGEGEGARVREKRSAEKPLDDEDSWGRKVAHAGQGNLSIPTRSGG